ASLNQCRRFLSQTSCATVNPHIPCIFFDTCAFLRGVVPPFNLTSTKHVTGSRVEKQTSSLGRVLGGSKGCPHVRHCTIFAVYCIASLILNRRNNVRQFVE